MFQWQTDDQYRFYVRVVLFPVKLSTYGCGAFSFSAQEAIWNRLPECFRDYALTLDAFMRYLKTFVFARRILIRAQLTPVTSGVATLEHLEQLFPGFATPTCAIRANPSFFFFGGGWVVGGMWMVPIFLIQQCTKLRYLYTNLNNHLYEKSSAFFLGGGLRPPGIYLTGLSRTPPLFPR